MADLSEMSDSQLAEWQAGWKEHSGKYILAERERERRMVSHEFSLQKQIAAANQKWSIVAAVIGLVGTLGGVALGAYLAQEEELSRRPTQSQAQDQPGSLPSATTGIR